MAATKSELQARSWRKDQFVVSANHRLIPASKLVDIFDSAEFYWAKAIPVDAIQEMLENSLCFGLFEEEVPNKSTITNPELKFIGIARCITDYVTFAYLTDVWVDPTYQGKGLGSWLVQCVQEIFETMPHLRRSMLFTADWKRSVPFYQKLMDMNVIETQNGKGLAVMECKWKGHPMYGHQGAGYGKD